MTRVPSGGATSRTVGTTATSSPTSAEITEPMAGTITRRAAPHAGVVDAGQPSGPMLGAAGLTAARPTQGPNAALGG